MTTAYEARLATRYETLDRSPMTPLDVRPVVLADPYSLEGVRVTEIAANTDVPVHLVDVCDHDAHALAAIVATAPLLVLTVEAATQVRQLLAQGFLRRVPDRTYLLGSEHDADDDSLLKLAMQVRAGGFGVLTHEDTTLPFLADPTLVPTWAEAKVSYAALHAENALQAAENLAARQAAEGQEWTEEREIKVNVSALIDA